MFLEMERTKKNAKYISNIKGAKYIAIKFSNVDFPAIQVIDCN